MRTLVEDLDVQRRINYLLQKNLSYKFYQKGLLKYFNKNTIFVVTCSVVVTSPLTKTCVVIVSIMIEGQTVSFNLIYCLMRPFWLVLAETFSTPFSPFMWD